MLRPNAHRRIAEIAAGILFLFSIAFVVDYFAYPYGISPQNPAGNTGENGLWIRYTYYFGEKNDAAIQRLARQLREQQIRDAYFHVRFIERSGALHFRYPDSARRLNEIIHREAPASRSIAWVYAGNGRGAGNVDLNDPLVRQRMTQEARWLTVDCGFDGVQWDYEICPDGDVGLLRLLEETRTALPPGKILSVATALWEPSLARRFGYGWSEEYFGKVAVRSDQLCVMAYDSALYLPRAYVNFLAEQMVIVTRAAQQSNPKCRVLMGVPTYAAGGASHHAHAENLTFALRGVRAGLARTGNNRRAFAGVALFADYTTSPSEWETYRRLWLTPDL